MHKLLFGSEHLEDPNMSVLQLKNFNFCYINMVLNISLHVVLYFKKFKSSGRVL